MFVLCAFETFENGNCQPFGRVLAEVIQVNQADGRAVVFLFQFENPLEQARFADAVFAAEEGKVEFAVLQPAAHLLKDGFPPDEFFKSFEGKRFWIHVSTPRS